MLDEEAGSSDLRFPNGQRDRDASGELLSSRRRADGRGMRLADFLSLPVCASCKLEEAEVAGLRFYSTAAFVEVNEPLRDQDRFHRDEPHPLPITVMHISKALSKLRTVDALVDKQVTPRPHSSGVQPHSAAVVACRRCICTAG